MPELTSEAAWGPGWLQVSLASPGLKRDTSAAPPDQAGLRDSRARGCREMSFGQDVPVSWSLPLDY